MTVLPTLPVRFRVTIEGEVAGIAQAAVPAWLAGRIALPIDMKNCQIKIETTVNRPDDLKLMLPNA